MKLLNFCKSKIHRATVTECDVDYVGSITIDSALMKAAGLFDGELVHVWNLDNGERLETYLIEGPAESGVVCLTGAAALKAKKGDRVIICAFCLSDEPVKRKAVMVDEKNRICALL